MTRRLIMQEYIERIVRERVNDIPPEALMRTIDVADITLRNLVHYKDSGLHRDEDVASLAVVLWKFKHGRDA